MKSEFELIEWIRSQAPAPKRGLGIGDDAAVIPVAGRQDKIVTTDAIVENVDFIRGRLSPRLAGRKALAINLSDLAAMGAQPESFVLTLGIPKDMKSGWVQEFCRGLFSLARRFETACIGGDLSQSGSFFASVTMLGKTLPGKAVTRSGAKPGDRLYVTGKLGGSILRHHASFEPRVKEGLFLAEKIKPSAMMDVSDGLAQDLGHLLRASKTGASIELEAVPVSRDAFQCAKGNASKALQHALSDGEDFELLFTIPQKKEQFLEKLWTREFPRVPLTAIGSITAGTSGIRWMRQGKTAQNFSLSKKGYRHF